MSYVEDGEEFSGRWKKKVEGKQRVAKPGAFAIFSLPAPPVPEPK